MQQYFTPRRVHIKLHHSHHGYPTHFYKQILLFQSSFEATIKSHGFDSFTIYVTTFDRFIPNFFLVLSCKTRSISFSLSSYAMILAGYVSSARLFLMSLPNSFSIRSNLKSCSFSQKIQPFTVLTLLFTKEDIDHFYHQLDF